MRSSFSKKLIERKLNLGKASTLERPPALAKALVSSSVAKTSDKPADKNNYHLVFSTSCSKKDWQSYLFFYLAMAHEQSGDVTHVVSGCQDQETEDEIRQMHEEQHTKAMSENFHIHFTPEYSNKKDFQTTKYWNKPFGVRHWLEHRFGFEYDKSKADVAKPTEYDDDIVILIDPDMLMLKPFHNNFTAAPMSVWNRYFQKRADSLFYEVKQGQVISQEYAFGGSWLRGLREEGRNLTYVLGTAESRVLGMSMEEASNVYAGGPPYLATARDFYEIAYHWTDFVPRYYEQKPGMMNEMYGYSMAVAHLGLKHQLAKGFMISDVNILGGEGWEFMKETFPKDEDLVAHACDMPRYSQNSLPQVLHFCQRYGIGEFFISKYKVPRRTFTCEFPLYEEPPIDIAKELYTHMGNFEKTPWEADNDIHTAKRAANAYMVCSLYAALNKAATFFKDHHCEAGQANYDKSWQYFKVYDKDPHGPGGGGGSKSKA
ncbi:MAG: hypothetical protein SGBAC_005267 [Bacillariaceae sp.]